MEEMLDVLDENGVKTGEIATREKVHRLGLWHRVVVLAIIDKQNRILLQQRSNDKVTNPNKWDIAAAGHIDANESSLSSVIREAKEEIGIDISANLSAENFHYIFSYRRESVHELAGDQLFDKQYFDCYLARIPEINVDEFTLQISEVQNVKLCTLEEFLHLLDAKILVNRQPFYDEIIRIMKDQL